MSAPFRFSRHGLPPRERWRQRVLECVPGGVSWGVLVGLVGFSIAQPLAAAAVIIAFYLYWLLRVFYLTTFLVLSYARLACERQTDWMARARGVDRLEAYAEERRRDPPPRPVGARISWWIHRRELEALRRCGQPTPPVDAIHHVVILPILREGREIYEPGLESIRRQDVPARRILVVLAIEARASEAVRADALQVRERYRSEFLDVLMVVHPDGLPGEARVKGANTTWAAKAAAQALRGRGILFDQVIVSCFDADTVVSPRYFACLTYHFLICPDRTRASFQPIPVYHNNIWDVPSFARVLDVGASFFQLIEATNPEKLVTFSSHSLSFQALVDMDHWPVDMISDDSAIFWKGLLRFEGDYRAVPMYITVSMDIASGRSWWATARSVYQQKRRWAWGVENFPIVVRGFLQARRIGWWDRLRHAFKLLEGHVAWATWPLILLGLGWLPVVFVGRDFATSVTYYAAPRIAALVFQLASLGLFVSVSLSLLMLPRPAGPHPLLKRLQHVGEWLFVPLIAVVFSAVPALDAQTRLLLGRSLSFQATEKTRGWARRRAVAEATSRMPSAA